SASPWLAAVRRKRRRRPTTGAPDPERARSRNTTKLSGAPQQSNQDALDLVAASAIELGRAGRSLIGDHCPLHSCGFSRLPSLPPPLAQGRIVARLRNAQNAAGLRNSGAGIIMGEHHLTDQARREFRGPAEPD